jgi:hypothetical protein
MKHIRLLLLSLMVLAVPLAWTGCVVGGGGGYYSGGVWVHDDVWIDGGGRGWYGGGYGYAHPGRWR